MFDYRAYLVGKDGHFETFRVVQAESDERAIEVARQFAEEYEVEVWHLDRKVAVVTKDSVS